MMLNHQRHGRGPTVVLQHGFVGGGGYFAPQAAALARHFDVICPDLPGFAGSAEVSTPMGPAGLSAALVGLLDDLGVKRFSLLGHSLGGAVALQTALDHGERIERLVLYGTGCSGNLRSRFETVAETVARIERDGIDATARRIATTWFVRGDADPFFELCVAAGRGASTESATAALAALAGWDVTGRLDELRMPVLVICGDRDRSYALEDTLAMTRRIPDARLCVLPECAHAAHLEKAELFTGALAGFLLEAARS